MIESSNSSLRSVTVTSLISTPESIQICFMPVIFIISYSCSPAAVQLLSGSSLSLLSLYPSFEQSTAQNLSWERDRAPCLSHEQDTLLGSAESLAMVCVSQGASLNSHQPESRWKTGLETIQPDRCTHDRQCWMQSWCFFWLPGGDSDHNYGSLSTESFLSGPKSYCTCRLQMSCCFFWTTPGSFTVFSAKSSFLFGPSIFSF